MTKSITFSDLLLFDNVNRKRSKTFHKLKTINNIIDFKVLENFVTGLYKTNKSKKIYYAALLKRSIQKKC